MANRTDTVHVCIGCGGPIAVPARPFHGEPHPVRRIGVPGEPSDCPK
ncbi:hypothetical protein [Streptomyces griseus]